MKSQKKTSKYNSQKSILILLSLLVLTFMIGIIIWSIDNYNFDVRSRAYDAQNYQGTNVTANCRGKADGVNCVVLKNCNDNTNECDTIPGTCQNQTCQVSVKTQTSYYQAQNGSNVVNYEVTPASNVCTGKVNGDSCQMIYRSCDSGLTSSSTECPKKIVNGICNDGKCISTGSTNISPTPTCVPRPSCMDANPPCTFNNPPGVTFCPKTNSSGTNASSNTSTGSYPQNLSSYSCKNKADGESCQYRYCKKCPSGSATCSASECTQIMTVSSICVSDVCKPPTQPSQSNIYTRISGSPSRGSANFCDGQPDNTTCRQYVACNNFDTNTYDCKSGYVTGTCQKNVCIIATPTPIKTSTANLYSRVAQAACEDKVEGASCKVSITCPACTGSDCPDCDPGLYVGSCKDKICVPNPAPVCGNNICEENEYIPCPEGAQCVWSGTCPEDCEDEIHSTQGNIFTQFFGQVSNFFGNIFSSWSNSNSD